MIEARNLGIKRILLPKSNAKEASIITDLDVIPVSSLNEVIDYLNAHLVIDKEPSINFLSNLRVRLEFII